MKSKIEPEMIIASVDMCLAILTNMSCAKYGAGKKGLHIDYMRNVLINLIGNFMLAYTDDHPEDALQDNINMFIEDIKLFFAQIKKQKNEAH